MGGGANPLQYLVGQGLAEPASPILHEVPRRKVFGQNRIISESAKSRRAGPRVVGWIVDQPSSDWVLSHIAESVREMGRVGGAGQVTTLPEVAGSLILLVEVAGVVTVQSVHQLRVSLLRGGPCDEVVVIGYQTVGADLDVAASGVLEEELQEVLPVCAVVENDLLSVPSLSDVMGESGNDDS